MEDTPKIRQLTTGTFDFPGMIQDEECKYVDKTVLDMRKFITLDLDILHEFNGLGYRSG